MDNNDVLQHELDEYEGHTPPAAGPMDAEELGGVGVGIDYLLADDSENYPPPAGSYRKLAIGGATPQLVTAKHLEVGDILVSTTATALSRAIRDHTGKPVSHAFMYVGDGKIVEADGPVAIRTLHDALNAAGYKDYYAAAYRVPGLTQDDKDGLVRFAERLANANNGAGADFDFYGMVRHLVRVTNSDPNAWYCSELVFGAYNSIGKPLKLVGKKGSSSINPDDTYPGHVLEIQNIQYVGHVKVPASVSGSITRAQSAQDPFAHWGGADAMSTGASEYERAIRTLVEVGATRQEAADLLGQAGVADAMAMSMGTAMGTMSTVTEVTGYAAKGLIKMLEKILRVTGVLNPVFALCNQLGISIAVGIGFAGGFGGGAGGGFGVVVMPGKKIGYYGALSTILGYILEVGASIDFTVIKGGKEAFDGTSVTWGGSVDASEGPGVGFRLISTPSGQPIGFTFQITMSAGVPGFSAVEFTRQVTQTWSNTMTVGSSKSVALDDDDAPRLYRGRPGQVLPPPPAASMAAVMNSPWR